MRKIEMTEEFVAPPPLPNMGDTDSWYYVTNGVKHGPVSATTIRDLLRRKEIETDAQVWRKGMLGWKSIRESDLAELVATEPPTISPQHIGNGYVWVLAILPLVWGVIDASINASNQQAAARTIALGFPYHPSRGLPFQIPIVVNALFGWLDESRLRKAGYGSNWLRAAAVLLAPVYLFVRAKRLRQTPWYAICWIVTFLFGIFLVAAVQAGL
jgi:GYF domain 2